MSWPVIIMAALAAICLNVATGGWYGTALYFTLLALDYIVNREKDDN